MDQIPLLIDSLNDAIRDTVRALGGSKIVGPLLWPARNRADRFLDDCVNPNNERKLAPEEVLHVARLGRERGIHMITAFFNSATGYAPPVPVDPDDTKAELQRQFIDAVGRAERLGKLITSRT